MFSFILADPNDVLFCKLQTQPLFFSALFLHCNLTNTIIKGHFRYWKCSVDAGRDGYLGKWQESSKLKNKIQSSLKISKSFVHCLFTCGEITQRERRRRVNSGFESYARKSTFSSMLSMLKVSFTFKRQQ